MAPSETLPHIFECVCKNSYEKNNGNKLNLVSKKKKKTPLPAVLLGVPLHQKSEIRNLRYEIHTEKEIYLPPLTIDLTRSPALSRHCRYASTLPTSPTIETLALPSLME